MQRVQTKPTAKSVFDWYRPMIINHPSQKGNCTEITQRTIDLEYRQQKKRFPTSLFQSFLNLETWKVGFFFFFFFFFHPIFVLPVVP